MIALLTRKDRNNFLFSSFKKDATPSYPICNSFVHKKKKEIHFFSLASNMNTNIKLLQTIGTLKRKVLWNINCIFLKISILNTNAKDTNMTHMSSENTHVIYLNE